MMNKIRQYTKEAVDFATPYVKEAGEYASYAAKNAEKKLRKKARASRRHRTFIKIKNAVELTANLMLVIAALAALLAAVKRYITEQGD